MTAEPLTPERDLHLVPAPSAGRPDELAAFTRAARTALRFLTLPAVDRARVLADLAHLEAEVESGDVRPHLAAALRFEIETTIESHVGADDPAAG